MTTASHSLTPSHPNRRQVLRLAGAATAMALPAAAQASVDPLSVLYSHWVAAKKRANAATERLSAIRDQLSSSVFGDPNPDLETRKRLDLPAYTFGPIALDTIERANRHTEELVKDSGCPEIEAEYLRRCRAGAARVAWWHEATRQQLDARKASGYDAAFDADGDAWSEVGNIERAIMDARATSLAGVRIKLEVAADPQGNEFVDYVAHPEELDWDELCLFSALADARALAGRAGA